MNDYMQFLSKNLEIWHRKCLACSLYEWILTFCYSLLEAALQSLLSHLSEVVPVVLAVPLNTCCLLFSVGIVWINIAVSLDLSEVSPTAANSSTVVQYKSAVKVHIFLVKYKFQTQ